jgi:hypothetical protein
MATIVAVWASERARAVGRWRVKCNGYQITVTRLARLSTLEIRGKGLAGLCDPQKSGMAHRFGDVAGSLRERLLTSGRMLLGKFFN